MDALSRWIAGCVYGAGYGHTDGDTYWQGKRYYSQPFLCPNGLHRRCDNPSDVPAMRRRIDKAKAFICEHDKELRVRNLAERLTDREVRNDIKEISVWVNSLRRM